MAYDVVVIGSGPGGHMCAVRAAQLGQRVALVEKGKMGGVCSNTGCIPTKALVSCAQLARKLKNPGQFGIRAPAIEFDFSAALKRCRLSASTVSQGVSLLLKSHGVECLEGEARLESPSQVRVGERLVEATNIVLATGGHPIHLPGVSYGPQVITGEEVSALESCPKSVIIIGGGVEGVEYAGIFASFGIEVTVIELADRLICAADLEASQLVAKSLAGLGVKIMTNTRVEKIEGTTVTLNTGQATNADLVVIAIGKKPNIGADVLGLGVRADKKGIIVDQHMRTSIPNIYAVGDVAGGGLAHVASEQGVIAAHNIAGQDCSFDGVFPYCIFTVPEVAAVGDISGVGAAVGRFPFAALGRATASGDRVGFAKVFVKDNLVAGAVIAGSNASDLIAEAALAVKNKVPVDVLTSTIHAHPTYAEAFLEAVRDASGCALSLPPKKSAPLK
ncbi:dihydrolipoyl dehydrogenase [Candidatus Parvarchaeota archaeon]|nr:dihydrolipoyl dehydrogenase [Candidatus Parvarchaeota archaeon]